MDQLKQIVKTLDWTPAIGQLIDLALQEDLGRGDITTDCLQLTGPCKGRIICREPVVVCGLPLIQMVLRRSTPSLTVDLLTHEGDLIAAGAALAEISGLASELLKVERTLLNFLMRMCGVATLTRRYRDAIKHTQTRIVDTRKTLPGWRGLDKYAVHIGGGDNHRQDLGSGILIKDNHIVAHGSISEVVRQAKALAPHPLRIEIEVESLEQALTAVEAGAEILLLDNMTPAQVREVADQVAGRAMLEVSGGITLKTILSYAEAGAQIISVGALTHSAPAVDLSLDMDRSPP